jgi:hypothetical protein
MASAFTMPILTIGQRGATNLAVSQETGPAAIAGNQTLQVV